MPDIELDPIATDVGFVRSLELDRPSLPPATRPAMRAETVKTDSAKHAFLSIPGPVLVVAAGGTITLCNRAASRLLGVDSDDVEGRQLDAVLAPLDELERLTTGGARAELPCELPGGRTARLGVRLGRYPQWSPRAARVLLLDDAAKTPDALPFEVADVLQLAARSKTSLVVDVVDGDSLFGRIVMHEGVAWSARDALCDGVEAFQRLALRPCAHATVAPLIGPPPARDLHGPLEGLLLEAARLRDDADRGAGADGPFAQLDDGDLPLLEDDEWVFAGV